MTLQTQAQVNGADAVEFDSGSWMESLNWPIAVPASCVPEAKTRSDHARAIAPRGAAVGSTEARLLADIRVGSERAFERLVKTHHSSMVRSAKRYVRDDAAAEDVVQETWMGFLESLDRFEGRCSIRTWLFRILMNKAKTRGTADTRYVPLTSDGTNIESDGDCACDLPHAQPSQSDPQRTLLNKEVHEQVRSAIAKLPAVYGDVIDMRDVQGFSASEVCDVLGLTEGHQRVLLHRARSRVRAELAKYLAY